MDSLQEQINYWKKSAERNWETTKGLFKLKRYDGCLFFCHLTIEKLLKGLVVIETQKQAPFIHDLPELSSRAKIEVPENIMDNLKIITTFNIAGRYDEIKFSFYKKCTKEYSSNWFNVSKEIILWLKKKYPKE